MKKIIIISLIIFVLYLAIVVGVGFLVHFAGTKLILFCVILGLVGAAALVIFLFWKKQQLAAKGTVLEANAMEADALSQLVKAADTRLKASPGAAKSLAGMPLVYVLGDENAGKTQTVLQSGLEAELLSGLVHRDGLVAPTTQANIWFTSQAAVVEAGGALLKQPGLWQRLVRLTQPNKLGAAMSKGALQPTRAAVLCVSIERIIASNSQESIAALARMMSERLRLLSQTLGISLPIYVLFTKLDTIPSFADYVATLTDEEIRSPLGALLTPVDAAGGMYAEQATSQIAQRFDELCYSLAEFRLEVLSRGGQADKLAKAYEFPRELRKMRQTIVDMLVELGRPSQLGVNPFLRGFYFVGMRARVVEETIAAAPSAAAPAADAGATRIFSFNAMQQAAAPAQAQRTSRRVPQWVFLGHLFPGVIFRDRSALDTSRASTKVSAVKRILIGAVAACFFLYFVMLTISYFHNAELESKLKAAAAQPVSSVKNGDAASIMDLQNLEQLRLIFAEIAGYKKDGAPLSYRWGLYPGDKLYNAACQAYGSHFATLLLTPTQTNILQKFAALPAVPAPTDEYTATYRPLRAYLITTSNPDKSTTDFEPEALLQAWVAGRSVSSDATDLARAQFTTYAETLPEPGSCMAKLGGSVHMVPVTSARAYLNHFQGIEAVYLSMKAAADKKFPSIRFNDKYPGSIRYVVDAYEVEGAFTKPGYDFMQKAFANPREYTSGEEWVLGPNSGQGIDPATVSTQLPPRYVNDYLNAWRAYMKAAHVVPGGSWAETKEKLHQLDSPASALGELFTLVSQNTDIKANPDIAKAFAAPQAVVPPTSTVLPQPYMAGLSQLESAIDGMLLTPGAATDPTAAGPVINAAGLASQSVSTIRGGFNPPDPTGNTDSLSEALLYAPIRSVEALAKTAPAAAAGGGAKTLCTQLAPIFNKFPLNPDSREDASLQELSSAFGPQGMVSKYVESQSKLVVLAGSQYIPAPGSTVTLNPAFLQFLNKTQAFSQAFFPAGGTGPKVEFSLVQEATPNLAPATLAIDGNTLATAGTTKSFTWVSSPTSQIHLNASGGSNMPASGTWSLFHFAYDFAKHPAPNRLEFIFQMNGHTSTNEKGVALDYKFDANGPGAPLLNPSYMHSLHCVTKVAQ
ncbi:MAG TPA: ImcF-related family protein [Acidobacteriaceae bacterium]|jgi:type VI secretion system protein ImpL